MTPAVIGATPALLALVACTYATSAPPDDAVDPTLRVVADKASIVISDALEALIAVGDDDTEDREFAWWTISRRAEPDNAADAFARAACAGRVAELRGMNAGRFVGEVERYGRLSMQLDAGFRDGAAQRMLATLYVFAPTSMLEHGDSETGLEMLEELVERWPDHVDNHLRLGEAYVELGDDAHAAPSLCRAQALAADLRPDHRALLERLVRQAKPVCPP